MYRYFYVCPRGFANEFYYVRVPLNRVREVDRHFAYFNDEDGGGYATWTSDPAAQRPGVAIDWEEIRLALALCVK